MLWRTVLAFVEALGVFLRVTHSLAADAIHSFPERKVLHTQEALLHPECNESVCDLDSFGT